MMEREKHTHTVTHTVTHTTTTTTSTTTNILLALAPFTLILC